MDILNGIRENRLTTAALEMLNSRIKAYDDDEDVIQKELTPQQELKHSIDKLLGAITLAVYLIISFATGAWYITWLIFPIKGCVKGLINAIIDLKEACKNEN